MEQIKKENLGTVGGGLTAARVKQAAAGVFAPG